LELITHLPIKTFTAVRMGEMRSVMSKKKQISNARSMRLLREARAGLIPECESMANEKRVRTNRTARIVNIAKTFLGSAARVSEEQAVTSILADLRHYCDCKNLAYRKLHTAAHALYLDDRAQEA
jgi:hypothetical protein